MTSNILEREKISILFLKYAIPAIISMVIAGSQTIIDGIFLGNFVGPNALASMNMTAPFMSIIFGFGAVIAIGSLSIIGRKLGNKETSIAQDAFKTALVMMMLFAFVLWLTGFFFNTSIAKILGGTPILIPHMATYIKTISFFIPFMMGMFLFGFSCRILGDPSLYLKSTVASLLINVFLDYLLIKYFNLGMFGAALATGSSYTTVTLLTLIPLLKRESPIGIFKGSFNKSLVFPTLYNGSSEAIISVSSSISVFIFNLTFLSLSGEKGVTAFTTINYLSQLGILTMFGISDGISSIISFNYGAKHFKRVKDILYFSFIVNFIIGFILLLIMNLLGETLISMFIQNSPQILSDALFGARIYSFSFLLCGFNIINSGFFTALGDARESVIVSLSRGLLFIIIGILLLPKIFGLTGVWLTVPFAELITFVLGVVLYKKRLSTFSLDQ